MISIYKAANFSAGCDIKYVTALIFLPTTASRASLKAIIIKIGDFILLPFWDLPAKQAYTCTGKVKLFKEIEPFHSSILDFSHVYHIKFVNKMME